MTKITNVLKQTKNSDYADK
nr:23S rRNA methyltransferase attenuation leader peptide [Staphylococcus aureus]